MKLYQIVLTLLLTLSIGTTCNANTNKTIFKGKVNNWLTDTIFLSTLSFHSPYSTETKYCLLSPDRTFEFEFPDCKESFVFFVGPQEHMQESHIKSLLFDNLTSKHYYGHCIMTYTCGFTTYLIEPGQTIHADITFQISKSGIEFHNKEKFGLEYYQTSFNLDDKCDKALEKSKTIKSGIKNLKKKEVQLLSKLNKVKDRISPFLYEYLKAGIEFGARKEFVKFLRFSQESYLNELYSEKIPEEILEIVEFDKSCITYPILLNEEYIEYIENYLNFKYSMLKGEYIVYKEFDNEKFLFAQEELPEQSRYYYLANNTLHKPELIDEKHIKQLISSFPNGELNDSLKYLLQK